MKTIKILNVKRLGKPFFIAMTALTLAVTSLGAASPQIASAITSCPTDLLSALTPYNTNYSDSSAINVGVKFGINSGVSIRGVKFYKGVDNTGTHVAYVTDSNDDVVATKTFSGETSSGWQTVTFDDDVALANPGYGNYFKVWVSMPNGHYAVDSTITGGSNHFYLNEFGSSTDDPVFIPEGTSGLYEYTSTASEVPDSTTTSNYWVSPIIVDETNPTPVDGLEATDAAAGPTLSWTEAPVDPNDATLDGGVVATHVYRDDGVSNVKIGETNAGPASSWNNVFSADQNDVTALPGTAYTYTLKSYDSCGNVSTSDGDIVTTASAPAFDNIFSTDPSTLDTGQTTPISVGMRWESSVAGELWGVRIYRDASTAPQIGQGPSYNLVAKLWDSSGNEIASSIMPDFNEQDGWIDVRFAEPVEIDANTEYIAGYYTPNGREMYTTGVFSSPVTNGDLTATAGAYKTTGSFQSAPNNSWYGIDVDFYEP